MRRSIEVMPGVRLNVSAKSIGVSAGVRGARVSVNSKRGTTTTVGIPGTGISYSSRSGSSTARRQGVSARPAAAPVRVGGARPVQPGVFAPAWEKAIVKIFRAPSVMLQELQAVGAQSQEAARIAALLEVVRIALPAQAWDRARKLCDWMFGIGYEPTADPILIKYGARVELNLPIAEGISVDLVVDRNGIGLLLAELEQNAGGVDRAIQVVEQLEPTTISAVSLAELYAAAGRWADVVDLTNGVTNEDDATVYLLTRRAVAFREQGHFEASRESLKEALRSRSRSAELRQAALIERGSTYLAEGKKGMARKDYERVLAENSDFTCLRDLLAAAQ